MYISRLYRIHMLSSLRFIPKIYYSFLLLLIFALGLVSCNPDSESNRFPEESNGRELKVVATTTIVGDVVRQIGGDKIALDVLLPIGVDPHSYDPSRPAHPARIRRSDQAVGLSKDLMKYLLRELPRTMLIGVTEGRPRRQST